MTFQELDTENIRWTQYGTFTKFLWLTDLWNMQGSMGWGWGLVVVCVCVQAYFRVVKPIIICNDLNMLLV